MFKIDKNKKPKSSNNLLPFIFSLGFIGWGFFALDRLLPQKYKTMNSNVIKQYQNVHNGLAETKENNESWKQNLKSWLSSFLEDNKELNEPKDIFTKKNIVDNTNIPYKEEVLIYNYELNIDNFPILTDSPFFLDKSIDKTHLNQIETIFIKTIELNQNTYSNSIPIFSESVELLSVQVTDSSILLNFNEEFGKGVSLQLFKYQIQLLLKTALQFSDIDSIQLKINNQEIDYLEGDGISIPNKIDLNSTF